MSIAVVTAKTIGPLIGYAINLKAIHQAKEALKKLIVTDEEVSDELANTIRLMESGKYEQGVDELVEYRSKNDSSSGFRVVRELYLGELKTVSSKLNSLAHSQNIFLKGPAYSLDGRIKQLINDLSKLS